MTHPRAARANTAALVHVRQILELGHSELRSVGSGTVNMKNVMLQVQQAAPKFKSSHDQGVATASQPVQLHDMYHMIARPGSCTTSYTFKAMPSQGLVMMPHLSRSLRESRDTSKPRPACFLLLHSTIASDQLCIQTCLTTTGEP